MMNKKTLLEFFSYSDPDQLSGGLQINERAAGTLLRSEKGPITAPPVFDGILKTVVDSIVKWPDVTATSHWDLFDSTRIDGIDFYINDEELGHIHLDGSIHLATSAGLGKELIKAKLAKPLPYIKGWVEENVHHIGADASIHLFRLNYNRILLGQSSK